MFQHGNFTDWGSEGVNICVCVCDTGPAHVQSPIRRKDMRSAVFWPGEFWLMHELDVIKRPIILFARCERVRQPGYIA